MPAPDPKAILQALAYGFTGEFQRGLDTLQPIVDAGPHSTYALLGSLAETASKEARETNTPGTTYGIALEGLEGAASIDDLPPPVRFAARFITAWANRDHDATDALFWAIAEPAVRDGTDALGDCITAVYAMAVPAAEHIVREQRRLREEGRTE
ncbi:hypothetical protein ACIQZO_34965 [Streptomyces sp. NPDC097617]|uniref:hypothetical protein n=1 Tax=Streptomyces sp. NPDC097617 TaxID=3366091 RepID=UPI00380E958C